MNKKIFIFLAVVSAIITVITLSAFADNEYPNEIIFEQDTLITFKNNPTLIPLGTYNIQFTWSHKAGTNLEAIVVESSRMRYSYSGGAYMTNAYSSGYWEFSDTAGKQITIKGGQTITNSNFIRFLVDNVASGLPEPPPPPPDPIKDNALANTNAMFGTTLSVMTVIITWLLANQIALCGLYLYILIACIGIGKRFVKT